MKTSKKVFLSVHSLTPAFDRLVTALFEMGYELIASGETLRHINEQLGLPVTVTPITGIKSAEGGKTILGHWVENLCPQIHAGLLADEIHHMEEFTKLGWFFIDGAVCTFDSKAINGKVFDIGGPNIIRSAVAGRRPIVVVDENDFDWVVQSLHEGEGDMPEECTDWLHAKAMNSVAQYVATESVFRTNCTRPE